MRKIIALTCIIFLFVLFTPKDTLSIEEIGVIVQPNAIDVIDLSAPSIVLNVSSYNATGELFGSIIENDSNIESYQILLNGTDITVSVTDSVTSHLVTFSFNANDIFNDVAGLHNYLEIIATNDGVAPSPFPTFKQGGAGGGGGFLFCDDQDCWGPLPLHPDSSNKGLPEIDTLVNDTTAPFGFFDLSNFPCCGNIVYLNHTEYESAVNYTNTITTLDTKSFFANNTEGISQRINITWIAEETIPTPTPTSYFAFSSLLFFVIIAVYVKRKQFKT